jgi:LEA14-like dessication related protein
MFFAINSPEIQAEISILSLTSQTIDFDTKLDIENPNFFDLYIENIKIESENYKGKEFTSFSFKGGKISGNDRETFSTNKSIEFYGNIPRILKNKITIGMKIICFGFIEKNIPIEIIVDVSLDEFLDKLDIPKIVIKAGIENLTEEGLFFYSDIEINNPTDIELKIEDILLDLKVDTGRKVGQIDIEGGTLPPRGTLVLDGSGNLKLKVLDADNLSINLIGKATANIAGLIQSFNLSASVILEIPDLSELLNLKKESFDFSIATEFKIRVRGLVATVNFKVYNPSSVPLQLKDLICYVYGVNGENKDIITVKEMEPCGLASKNEVCIITKLNIPYLKVLMSGKLKLFPQWLSINIIGNFYIEGTNQSIPISINGYLDPHIFR